jgi:hypothetical protein
VRKAERNGAAEAIKPNEKLRKHKAANLTVNSKGGARSNLFRLSIKSFADRKICVQYGLCSGTNPEKFAGPRIRTRPVL